MAVTVNLKKGNLPKKGFVGFSWTTFFFNFFVPLFRGDFKWVGIMFATEAFLPLIVGAGMMGGAGVSSDEMLGFSFIITLLIYRIIISFIYNKFYTENLLREGFEPVGDADRTALKFHGLYKD